MPKNLAIITGGSRGIGQHVVKSLLDQMDVLNLSRTAVFADNGLRKCFNLGVDLSDVTAVQDALTDWFENHRQYTVKVFISCAASLELGWLRDVNTIQDMFPRAFSVNVQAPFSISSLTLRLGRFCASDARVIYVTSSLARPLPTLSYAGLGLYSASKAALERLALVQARELAISAPYLKVVLAHPGIVDTQMQRDLRESEVLDAAFATKTAGLPNYQQGDWATTSPLERMRTITPRFAADFIVWLANMPHADLQSYYDFYAASEFHSSR